MTNSSEEYSLFLRFLLFSISISFNFFFFFFRFLQPNRLISPDTILKRRHGNCFEIATLLCSLLIGNRYAAMVVSGYASREVTNNDQQRVMCPNIPSRFADLQPQVGVSVFLLERIVMKHKCNKYIFFFCPGFVFKRM